MPKARATVKLEKIQTIEQIDQTSLFVIELLKDFVQGTKIEAFDLYR